ncbi:MAG TPA: hypothetical protein VGL14_02930 [Methylomirabilota bacterium]
MRVVIAVVGLAYPLLIYAGLVLVGPRTLAAAAAVLLLAHAASGWRRWRDFEVGGPEMAPKPPTLGSAPAEPWRSSITYAGHLARAAVPVLLVGAVLAVAAAIDDGRIFLFVPALVNGAMLIAFARTLVQGPSIIETFARLRHPELLPSRAPYLRAVTAVWCGFFAVNIVVSLVLAVHGSLATWTLYNGLIAYLIVGLLLGAERVYRYWRFRGRYGDLLDPVLRRVFPPRAAGGGR